MYFGLRRMALGGNRVLRRPLLERKVAESVDVKHRPGQYTLAFEFSYEIDA